MFQELTQEGDIGEAIEQLQDIEIVGEDEFKGKLVKNRLGVKDHVEIEGEKHDNLHNKVLTWQGHEDGVHNFRIYK